MNIKEKWVSLEELGDRLSRLTNIIASQVGGLTTGSVPFADASGFLTEDNDKLFWDSAEYNLGIGTATFSATMTQGIQIATGLAPTANVADTFAFYSADFADGNACPHFRTENGTVIGLNQSMLTNDVVVFAGLTVTDYIYFDPTVEHVMTIGFECGKNLAAGGTYNYFFGEEAGYDITTGDHNILIGYQAGKEAGTVSYRNVCIGHQAGLGVDGNSYGNNVFIGHQVAMAITTSLDNVGIGAYALTKLISGTRNAVVGYQAGYEITTGYRNTLLGYMAGYEIQDGYDNTAVGYEAMHGVAVSGALRNVCIGAAAGYDMITGSSQNVLVGVSAGYYTEDGGSNVCIGYRAGYGVDGETHNSNTFVGTDAGFGITTGGNNTFLGSGVGRAVTSGGFNVLIGYLAGESLTIQSSNVIIGSESGRGLTGASNTALGTGALRSGGGGGSNTAIGTSALYVAGALSFNTAVGAAAGISQNTGHNNCYFGYEAGRLCDGNANVDIGRRAGYYAKSGSNYNINIGYETGMGNIASVHTHNVIIGGYRAGYAINEGDYNIMLGSYCGDAITSGGNNVLIGYKAGSSLSTHSGCVMIGYSAGENATTSNVLYIANSNTATPLIYGEFDNAYLLINGRLAVAYSTIGDDERGLSSIHTLSDNPAKSDGIGFYSEGHIGAIITDGPTYGAGIWLNIDAGATLGADVRALDIGIYEAGATCAGVNAYGLAIYLEFDDTDPPAAIYALRINCNDTPGHATPAGLIFAPNASALGLVTGDPGTADDAYLKIKLQDGSVYRIPLVKE